MGFDIVHMNLHKTFAVPHGGGGPGAGPVAVSERLAPFLPGPLPVAGDDGAYRWHTPEHSIGRVHSWHGNALALARAYSYILANGGDGLRRVAEAAVLNANWLRHRLRGVYDIPYDRPNMHECVLSAANLKRRAGVRAVDVAKRLLEEGFHAPTVYFPLTVDEALMIEPTETESPQTARGAGRRARTHRAGERGRRARRAPHDAGEPRRRGPRRPPLIPTWDARRHPRLTARQRTSRHLIFRRGITHGEFSRVSAQADPYLPTDTKGCVTTRNRAGTLTVVGKVSDCHAHERTSLLRTRSAPA